MSMESINAIHFSAKSILSGSTRDGVETYMRQNVEARHGPPEYFSSETFSEPAQAEVFEQVNPYTLEVIAQLFPAPTSGIEFTANILRYAKIIQNVLPGMEDLGEHVAVINTRTIRTLASMINWGYDTTHKYVTTFCALGLLHRGKHDNERQLIFPLKPYAFPNNLHALDKLIANSRPKVQQFAKKVKERLLELSQPPMPQNTRQEPSGPVDCDPRLKKTLFKPMLEVIKSEGIDFAKSQHIALRIVTEVISKFILPMKVVTEHELKAIQASTTARLASPSTPPAYADDVSQETESTPPTQMSSEYTDQGRLFSRRVFLRAKEEAQKVSQAAKSLPSSTKKGRLSATTVDSQTLSSTRTNSYVSVIDLYEQAMTTYIDWESQGLPQDFFLRIYDELKQHHQSMQRKSLLAGARGSFWASIEKNQIRRLAEMYQIDYTFAHNTIMRNTNRSHLLLAEPTTPAAPAYSDPAFYSEPVDFSQSVVLPAYTAVYPEDEFEYHAVDSHDTESTPTEDFYTAQVDSQHLELDAEEEAMGLRETLASLNPEELKRYRTNRQALLATNQYIEREAALEREKYLRIPSQLDSEKYTQPFIRNYVTDNIINLINKYYNNITLRKDLSIFFADVFDSKQIGDAEKWYAKLFADTNAESLVAGFIDTLILMHRPTKTPISQPGGFFNKRCMKCKTNGIDENVRARVEQYGHLTYPELVIALADLAKESQQRGKK